MSNVVSAMSVLLDVQRIFKPKDKGWMNDAIKSMGHAVKGMGTSATLDNKTKLCKVVGRRLVYPKDLYSLVGATYKGGRLPIAQGLPTAQSDGGGYFFNPGYIGCPFNEGEVTLHYKALPVDDKGFPLIRDEFDYILAIRWYIMADMLSSGYEHKVFSYKDCWNKWEEHSAKATNQSKMPSRDEMEALGNSWTRLFNDGNFIDNFGQGLEYGEDTITIGSNLSDYVDRNKLANNS